MTSILAKKNGVIAVLALSLILITAILFTSGFVSEVDLPVLSVHAAEYGEKALSVNIDSADAFGLARASYSATLLDTDAVLVARDAEQKNNEPLAGTAALPAAGLFEITYSVTPEEYEMLLYCVDHETRSGSLRHRVLITQVILNRVQGEKFPFTIAEVLMAPAQFDVMPFYPERGDWTPSEAARQAVDLVLSGESPDIARGARYFCNPYIVGEGNWFDASLTLVCEIEGHRFYR
ncbi:MAG: cell wall hydrolase [Clostridia bacterium]|nr:cell wall hydrolase [Clostridia bacterium]